MISAAAVLYDITGDSQYLESAQKSASAANYHFFRMREGSYISQEASPYFTSLLNEGYMYLYEHDPNTARYIRNIYTAVKNGYNNRTKEGLVYSGWQKGAGSTNSLKDQASTAKLLLDIFRLDFKDNLLTEIVEDNGEFSDSIFYSLYAKCSNRGLSVQRNSNADGANVNQQSTNYGYYQKWRIEHVGEGYYALINAGSGMALTVENGSPNSGTNVHQAAYTGSPAQKWSFTKLDDGYYRLTAMCAPGTSLDVDGSSRRDGANIQQWESNTSDAQRWLVTPSDLPEVITPQIAVQSVEAFIREYLTITDGVAEIKGNYYWDRAESFEVILDAYERNPSEELESVVMAYYNGFVKQFGQNWEWNDYNDDIMWMVIACSRAYNLTGEEEFKAQAKFHFDKVYERAYDDTLGGGLYWKRPENNTKNACINSPAAIAACLLAEIYEDESYYEKALDIYEWTCDTLFDQDTGRIYDHMTIEGKLIDWKFTYNQGTFIGASVLLYKHYGNEEYLNNAIKAAEYTRDDMYRGGVMNNEDGGNDAPGFKGIFTRWIKYLITDCGQTQFIPWMELNASYAWSNRNSKDLVWTRWATKTPDEPIYSFSCSTAVALLQNYPYELRAIK